MRNTWFRFKEFIVHQHKSGMKVCTDSCLFGAWIANKADQNLFIGKHPIQPLRILDIGTGTGLLALMLAQKSPAQIDAVEIEKNAFEQAMENFAASSWAERLNVVYSDINEFKPEMKYDLIISNPPFYENDLKSTTHSKNLAKHHDGLLMKDLIFSIKNLLSIKGKFALLLPFHRLEEVIEEAERNGFLLEEKVLVKQTPKHHYFRAMLLFGKEDHEVINHEIMIKNHDGVYSDEFAYLLKDYYLD